MGNRERANFMLARLSVEARNVRDPSGNSIELWHVAGSRTPNAVKRHDRNRCRFYGDRVWGPALATALVANIGDPKACRSGPDGPIICIAPRLTRTLVALDGAYESFGHFVALRTFDRRCYRFETDLTGEVWSFLTMGAKPIDPLDEFPHRHSIGKLPAPANLRVLFQDKAFVAVAEIIVIGVQLAIGK